MCNNTDSNEQKKLCLLVFSSLQTISNTVSYELLEEYNNLKNKNNSVSNLQKPHTIVRKQPPTQILPGKYRDIS